MTNETLPFRSVGEGDALLLIHGAAEDEGMLEPQALAFAEHGRRAVWYDRRGVGSTDRTGWPDGGVAAHADDAAAIVRAIGGRAQVLGFSSGGVVAMELAARHLDLDIDVLAWEPAAVASLEDGLDLHAQILEPIEQHLENHPGDWSGAYAVMLEIISGGMADLDSAAAVAQMRNAESAVRDDARIITRHTWAPGSLSPSRVRLARGQGASDLHARVVDRLAAVHGLQTIVVEAALDHEVYLDTPEILATTNWARG